MPAEREESTEALCAAIREESILFGEMKLVIGFSNIGL
jgi:hypothetical protein